VIIEQHNGLVPDSAEHLRALPGVGAYTAAAVASFAYGKRHAVLDTNVRRVLARLISGLAQPRPTPTAAERALAESLLPADGRKAARWSVAVMELGALVCTAARPRCAQCPLAAQCTWLARGRPAANHGRPTASYEGSDRQCRGRLLAVLTNADGPVTVEVLAAAWHDSGQQARSLAALMAEGLVTRCADGALALPGDEPA